MAAKREVTFDRPIPAKLMVELANKERFEPKPDDLRKFGLVNASDVYARFEHWLFEKLAANGVPTRDLTDTGINPIRYLVECCLMYDHMPDDEIAAEIAKLARVTFDEDGA